ncbi:MAG: alpha-L-fucosidase [Rikenellaceae bacterium]
MINFFKTLRRVALVALFASTLYSCQTTEQQQNRIRKEALQEWKSMKFGLFIHWGIYSIPAGVWNGEQIKLLGEQIQRHAAIPHDVYAALASQFNPVNFDADAIVQLAKSAGMKYVVITAKHHDGFCMFDSAYTEFDIVDATPYKKDILKQLADACRKHGLKLGLYYSTPDWNFNIPHVDADKLSVFGKVGEEHEQYQVNQLRELLTNYGDIVELFFDMGEPTAAQSERFAKTVHETQPRCVINGRIMNNHGDFITMPDNHVPDVPVDSLAWETPGTFYHTWGYKSWVSGKGDPVDIQVRNQVRKLSTIVARGGNFLLNIGPKSDGSVVEYEVDVLKGIGRWMATNGEAIEGVQSTPFVALPWGECTVNDGKLYLHIHEWSGNGELVVDGLKSRVTAAYPLADRGKQLDFSEGSNGYTIDLKGVEQDEYLTIVVLEIDGEPVVNHPIISQSGDNSFLLSGDSAINHGKYGRESYRSILRDYYRSWDIDVVEPGLYEVVIIYSMRYDEKDFAIDIVGGSRLPFTLSGAGNEVAKAISIDGNETTTEAKPKAKKGQIQRVEVGAIELDKRGRTTIQLVQGQ